MLNFFNQPEILQASPLLRDFYLLSLERKSSLLMKLWRHQLSNMTSKFDDVISPTKVLQLIWNYRLFYLVVVITCSDFVGRDIQKYRYLQTSYTEDAIDVSLRRTPNACSQTLFSAKQERGILLTVKIHTNC